MHWQIGLMWPAGLQRSVKASLIAKTTMANMHCLLHSKE
jgi:hypothetical protein